MSTDPNTAVARGKVYLAAEQGQKIPETWAADENGIPTTDPMKAIEGLILPMAGHKGYAISFMMDVLSGVLTGSAFGQDIHGPYVSDKESGCGHFAINIDIEKMMPRSVFEARMDALIEQVKSAPRIAGIDEIFFPGEVENKQIANNTERTVELPQKTWVSLKELATETQAKLPATL